jgi:hypothetical protein
MEPMETQNKSNSSRVVVYIIIVIVLLLAIWWIMGASQNGILDRDGEEVTEIAPGETLRRAGDGELVAGFPREMILEEGVVANESYSINYSNQNLNQPVVSYTSALTLEENIDLYDAYLRGNNWDITHEATLAEAPVTFFYAEKDNKSLNLTFNAQGDDVQVTMALAIPDTADAEVEEDTIDNDTPVSDAE